MTARIYRPSRNAMQSGQAKTKGWVLDFEPETPRRVEPLMGWTSSADMNSQITLSFATREEAVAYAEHKGIPYRIIEPHGSTPKTLSYSDNFRWGRVGQWTH